MATDILKMPNTYCASTITMVTVTRLSVTFVFTVPVLVYLIWPTRAVRKVSSHFEYLENRSRGLDVTWQPVRGKLTVHP